MIKIDKEELGEWVLLYAERWESTDLEEVLDKILDLNTLIYGFKIKAGVVRELRKEIQEGVFALAKDM
jgi:hypothetical protein